MIVGAGSAGCIVAGKLAEETNLSILVLEAGGTDIRPDIKVPIGYGMSFFNSNVNWCYSSSPQKNLGNRELYVPRGKVVGGSGSINAMVYLRGQKNDFNDWASFSGADIGWESARKTYDYIEGIVSNSNRQRLYVSDVSGQHEEMTKNFLKAGNELGFQRNRNLNGVSSEGIGSYPLNTRNGFRWTSSDGFLKPTMNKKNIKLIRNAHVTKVLISKRRVTGIEFMQGNTLRQVTVRRGAILSAGAVNTPHLLMLSGIGPANKLREYGIEVVKSEKNIGQNLQDHLGIDYLFESTSDSLNKVLGTWRGRIKSAFQYVFSRTGAFSLSVNQAGGFVKWNSRNEFPNLQLYFNPLTYSIKRNPKKREMLKPDDFNGFAIGFQPCRPKSRGEVRLKSKDPMESLEINPNFLGDETDIHDVISGIECVDAIVRNQNIKSITVQEKTEAFDGKLIRDRIEDFKNRAVSIYHLCGTCRMGADPKTAPVSNDFELRGIENLWVADASLFPNVTSGNINAPTMMLAFKASDSIIQQLKVK